MNLFYWFAYSIGLTNDWPYLLWSGITGYVVGTSIWWFHNACHEHRCWRVGRHKVPGESGAIYSACKRHHPHLDRKVPFHFADHYDTAHHYDNP